MDLLNSIGIKDVLLQYCVAVVLFLIVVNTLYRMVVWGKKMSKGAFIFLAIFPLISVFPIPPPVFKNVEKAKQEQRKRKEKRG